MDPGSTIFGSLVSLPLGSTLISGTEQAAPAAGVTRRRTKVATPGNTSGPLSSGVTTIVVGGNCRTGVAAGSEGLSRDFHFGTRHEASIRPIAFLRSSGFGFSLRGVVFPPQGAVFACRKNPKPGNSVFSAHSTNTSPSLAPGSHSFALPIAFLYPLATASAPIRRTMLPNSRRVRWLSASVSQ